LNLAAVAGTPQVAMAVMGMRMDQEVVGVEVEVLPLEMAGRVDPPS